MVQQAASCDCHAMTWLLAQSGSWLRMLPRFACAEAPESRQQCNLSYVKQLAHALHVQEPGCYLAAGHDSFCANMCCSFAEHSHQQVRTLSRSNLSEKPTP